MKFYTGEEQEWAKILPTNQDSSIPLTDQVASSVSYHTIEQTTPRQHNDDLHEVQDQARTAQSDDTNDAVE